VEPCAELGGGLVKDGSRRGRNLVPAPSALEFLARGKSVKTIGLAAFASAAVWEPLVKQVLQASSLIRELFVKVFDRVFHFHASSLSQAVGHPQSNRKIYENFKALHAVKG
jgi:hypothetical protein